MPINQVQQTVITRFLPLEILLGAAVVFAVAAAIPAAQRRTFLGRAVFVALLAALLVVVALVAPGEGHVRLGSLYLLLVATVSAYALSWLWRVLPSLTDRRAALLVGAIALATFLAIDPYHRAVQPTESDEPHYLLITQSLVLDGDLDLADDYAGDRYRTFYEGTFPDVHGIHVGPHIYPIRDLGLPVVAVPFFALGGRLGVMALVSLAGAALVTQLYLLLRDLAVAPRIALASTALVALLHPFLTYTAEIEPELFAALLFAVAVRALRHGLGASPGALALASACAGLIGIFTTRGWPLSIGLGLAIALFVLTPRVDRVRRVAAGALPFALLVLAISYVDCLMFPFGDGSGRCWFIPSAGYYLIRDQQTVLSGGPQVGAAGLFLDRVFGLVSHVPLYLLAFAGVAPSWRRFRAGHAAELGTLTLAGLLLIGYISDVAYWYADGMPPSRYLVAPIPLLAAAVALGIEALVARGGRAGWIVVAVLAVPSAAVTALYAVLPGLGYDLAPDIVRTGYPGMLWSYLYEHWGVDPGLLFPSVLHPDGATPALVALWLAIALAFAAGGALATRALPLAAAGLSPVSDASDLARSSR